MKLVGQGFYGNIYEISDISRESFIHFTGVEPAMQILKSKKILMNPPYQKFGGHAIYAISTRYGEWIPSTQISHIKFPYVIGILFQTRTIPKVGFPEEVIWEKDIQMTQAKLIPLNVAKTLIQNAPFKSKEDFEVHYRKE